MSTYPYDDGYYFTDEECANALDQWARANPDRAVFLDFLWRGIERYSQVYDSHTHEFIDIDAIAQALGCQEHWDAIFSMFSIPDDYQTDEKEASRANEFVWCNDCIQNMLRWALSGEYPKLLTFGRLILVVRAGFDRPEAFEWAREYQRVQGGSAFLAGVDFICNPNSQIENLPLWEAWNDGWTHALHSSKDHFETGAP